MTWVKIDDHFDQHPKLALVGPLGMALFVAGLAYCNRNLTDGFIPWSAARSLLCWQFLGRPDEQARVPRFKIAATSGMTGNDVEAEFVIELLLGAGLWEEDGGGYRVHNYDNYQPSRAQVEAERVGAAERMAKSRQNKGRSSDEVQANNEGSSSAPVPVPVPVPSPRSRARTEAAAADTPGKTEVAVLDNAAREEAPNVFAEYERAFGKPVPNDVARQHLEEDEQEFGFECVRHSLEEAALAGVLNLKYAEAIMRRHKDEGCYTQSDGRLHVKRGPPATEWNAGLGERYLAGKAQALADRTPEQIAAIEAKAAEIEELAERL